MTTARTSDAVGAIPEHFDEETAAITCESGCDVPVEMSGLAALPTTTLATLFAPYEPALGLDLLLIRQVVEARAADPATYAEGENPFRIRAYRTGAQVIADCPERVTDMSDVDLLALPGVGKDLAALKRLLEAGPG